VLGREDCQVGSEIQVDGPATAKHRRPKLLGDNAERSTSADWRTADADDQQRQRLLCNCSPD